MKKIILLLTLCATTLSFAQELETIAELPFRPGNVAVSKEGRVFTTVHPLGSGQMQLLEITEKNNYEAFPNEAYQNTDGVITEDEIDTPLGIRVDDNNVLWVVDMGQNLGKTRVWGFDINSKKEVFKYEFPEAIAPTGSFVQDLAIDEVNGWIYLADIANPGILALNAKTKTVRRFEDRSVQTENIDMVIDGQVIEFGGAPARVAINPVTLSKDNETLYYGAMNGTTWYAVPAKLFREGASDYTISKAIKVIGPKPISDGVATDAAGNHYFTNLQHYGVDILTTSGELKPLVRDPKIDWADNVALDGNGFIYITVNQLHKTPAFTGGEDLGTPPYYILKMKL
ncbi:MAG: L-dopachrome tautomerase-related protein [Bacteroidota bacterium]